MRLRNISATVLLLLTVIAYGFRVIGAQSSAIYAQDTQLVRQSLEFGQNLLGHQHQTEAGGGKYPLTLTLYLTGVYGLTYILGQILGAFGSVSAFRDFLFANREAIYLIAVWAFNLISVILVPAIFFAQRSLNRSHCGWLAAGYAAFSLLLAQFGQQPRPHVPYATIAFVTLLLLALTAERVGGWRMLLAATVTSALTVGTLQSGVLITLPFLLALAVRPFHDGRYHWSELLRISTLGSLSLFVLLCIFLYPDIVSEYGGVILAYLRNSSSAFRLGAESHYFSLAMFNLANIPQFVSRLTTYQPILTLLLPVALPYFVIALRGRLRLLLVVLPFPLLNLVIWSLFEGAFPRITAVLLPFMIFASAYLAEDLFHWFDAKTGYKLRAVRPLVFMLIILPLAATSARLVWVSAQPDTRTLAVEWINENISPGETLLLNFQLTTLLPTNDAINRQNADFPGSIGTQWQWLAEQNEVPSPRFDIFNKMYWQSLDGSADARDAFIERAGIRYLLVRSQVARAEADEMVNYAKAEGRLLHTICPAYDSPVAELPDDMFYQAWAQSWQLQRPGPYVAIYDLQQSPDDPKIDAYCLTKP
ncbi:MAG: hypothetical protein OXG78_15030 [Chloroflexi bacterium]|nr:hypothetical protein [Chloroflexota bacterium]